MADTHFFVFSFILIFVFFSIALIFTSLLPPLALADTDPFDVQALEIMYSTLNSPSRLMGWKIDGGDPCGEAWKGIACEGSAVVSIKISGLGLNGTMGYLLSNLMSLREFDISDNKIGGTIPYQLPPNLRSMNLARNNLSGNLPYSISAMASLNYLNVSNNTLSLSTGEVFYNLTHLGSLDLSFNNFSSDLPSSFGSLSNLSSLFLQNNQFTGSLNVLIGLPLNTLNVANNHFNGSIPREVASIPNVIFDGNSFDNDPARMPSQNNHHSGSDSHETKGSDTENSAGHKNLTTGAMVSIITALAFLAVIMLLVLAFFVQKQQRKEKVARTIGESLPRGTHNVPPQIKEHGAKSFDVTTDLKLPFSEKVIVERMPARNGVVKQTISPITATPYPVASLQIATNSFSQEFLIGEGSVGRVYAADFSNKKTVAIKKIDNAALSLQEEDNFLEAVSNMSRLRHPNVVTLIGYCAEQGERLLVHEYIGNGNLYDMLHISDDGSKALSWNTRVRIALGIARALEYLHEVCLPCVVHRNLKSGNILLDGELYPHLSDCGLAALIPNTRRQISTHMVGSFGYSAPEFALSGIYTVKSDVYSFGVLMLELLTGRKPLDSSRVRSEQSLVRWATPQLHDIDALAKMVDPAMNAMYPAKSLSRFADIVALCVQPEPEFRPPMSEVVQALVRLVYRTAMVIRRSSEECGSGSQDMLL